MDISDNIARRQPELASLLAKTGMYLGIKHMFFRMWVDLQMSIRIAETLPAPAGTDGVRMYFNPRLYTAICEDNVKRSVFIVAHECLHSIFMHMVRAKQWRLTGLGGLPFDDKVFNFAADYIINALLIADNIGEMPPGCLHDTNITDGTDSLVDVYKKVYEQMPPSGKGSGEGEGDGDGEGSGASNDIGKAEGFDQHMTPTAAEAAQAQADNGYAVQRALEQAKACGSMPGNIGRVVDEMLEGQVPWHKYVRQLVRAVNGRDENSWTRLHRRRLAGSPMMIAPARRSFGAELVVVGFDTSGSMSDREITACFSELPGILKDLKPRRLLLLPCDARISEVIEINEYDTMLDEARKRLGGGGGTSFAPVFDYVKENRLSPDLLIYLTDMECSFPAQPDYPTIWVATTDIVAPWGDTVRLNWAD